MFKTGLGLFVASMIVWTGIALAPLEQAQAQVGDKMMQCMEKCIMDEGKDEKATCKTRCASTLGTGRGQKVDCGIQYKECRKACDKDKKCEQGCRADRRSCS